MPPVKRRLFNVLAAVSLVLCIAVVVLWVRSYFISEGFKLRLWNDQWYSAGDGEGRLCFWQADSGVMGFRDPPPLWCKFDFGQSTKTGLASPLLPPPVLGFSYGSLGRAGPTHIRILMLPLWSLVVPSSAVAV